MNSRTRKSLLQSYYRQRNIATQQNGHDFKLYEYNDFAIKNRLINLNNLDDIDVSVILSQKPKLIDYFKDRLSNLTIADIGVILSYQPKLINYFKDRLYELNQYTILKIIKKQPQLTKYFIKYYPKLNTKNKITMLTNTPNTYIVPNGHIISKYVEKNNGYVVQYFETNKYGILDKNFKLITNNYYDSIGYGFDDIKLSFGKNINDDFKYFNIDGVFFDVDKKTLLNMIHNNNLVIFSKEQR